MSCEYQEMATQSRRGALLKLILLPIGAAVALFGFERFSQSNSYVSIKVQYAVASAQIEPNPEELQIKSPATLYALKRILWDRHPALQSVDTIQVFLNGNSVEGNPDLREGDKLVFLAQYPGG